MLTPDQTLRLSRDIRLLETKSNQELTKLLERQRYREGLLMNAIMERIASPVCDYFTITKDQLLSLSQKREHVDARAVFVFLSYKSGIPPKHSAPFINRNRTTALHLLRKVAPIKEVAAHIPEVIRMIDL